MLVVLLGGVAVLAGCGEDAEPLTEDNIQQRVTDAMREAGTFHWTWTSAQEQVTWTGRIRYGKQGNVTALAFKSSKDVYRVIGKEGYHKYPGSEFSAMDAEERREVVKNWDLAQILETGVDVTKVTKRDEVDVGGVSATKYQVMLSTKSSSGSRSGTWWVTDDDRLVKSKMRGRYEDERVGWTATYTDYGEPIEVVVPVESD